MTLRHGARRTAAIVSILFLIFLLAACGGKSDAKYTLLSPVINPGGALTGDDFIMVSAFAGTKYTVTIDDPLETQSPGIHSVGITVTDKRGNEYKHTCTYTVRSYLRDSVRIEAGQPVTVDKFINHEAVAGGNYTFAFEDELALAGYTVGTYRVGIYVNDTLQYSSLILEDTTPPKAYPVTVHITDSSRTPRAEDFVSGITDATSVACEFKEEYDFNTTNDIYVTIILTDEAGNKTEITSFATCSVDETPPVIDGVHDITVVVGDTVSYRDGITVIDDSGERPNLVVDSSGVNLDRAGTYKVIYSATDSSGNTTTVEAKVTVIERTDG